MPRRTKIGLIVFCISLLFLACTLRSGVLVDRTFIPRFGLLSLIILAAWIAGVRRKIVIRHTLFEVAFILFYAWSLLSASWSIEASEAILQSQLVFLSLALFLVISVFAGDYSGFERLFIKTHLLVMLFSFGLAFYKMSLLVYYDPYKIISVSANNNLYSGFLLISLPLALAGYVLLRGAWKYLSVLSGILTLFFIIIVQSRAAYLGTAAATILSMVFLGFRYKQVFSKRNVLTGLLSLVLLTSGILVFTRSLDNVRRQYFLRKIMVWEYFRSYENLQAKNIRKLMGNEKDDHSKLAEFDFSEEYYSNANLRLIFWKKSRGLIQNHPFTGVGAGNWRLAIPSVINPPNPEHTLRNFTYSEPHNEWIRILSELGIPGIILAFFIFFLPPGFVFYRILRSGPEPPPETLFYAAFISGFCLFAAFDFPFRRVEHLVVFWSLVAFMLNKVPLPEFKRTFFRSVPKWPGVIFPALILFTLVIGFARLRGEFYTVGVFRNEHKNDGRVIINSQMAQNLFYHVTPNTLPLSWFEGVAYYRLGDNQAAMRCFRDAICRTPYEVRVLNDYSAVLFRLGNAGLAIRTLRTTLVIDPFFDDARFNLAAIYFLTGQRKAAQLQVLYCRESQKKMDFLEEMK